MKNQNFSTAFSVNQSPEESLAAMRGKLLAPLEPLAFALFRIVFGLLFLQFGTQKLFGWPNTPAGYTPTAILKIAACIELICGFLIMIGLIAEFAAFIASGEMAFAYFLGHFPIAFWPIVSKGVPAVLFCFAFLFIAAHGAGIWSLDSLWKKPLLRSCEPCDAKTAEQARSREDVYGAV